MTDEERRNLAEAIGQQLMTIPTPKQFERVKMLYEGAIILYAHSGSLDIDTPQDAVAEAASILKYAQEEVEDTDEDTAKRALGGA